MPALTFSAWPPEALYRRVLETGEPILGYELTGATPGSGGQRRTWLVSDYPVKDGRGRTFMVGAVVVDITIWKEAEEHLRRNAEFRERFLGIVSHDLRNPLNTIILAAQGMRRQALDAAQARAVSRILSAAERAHRLIRDLLDLTKGRIGGGLSIHPKPLELRQFAAHVVDESQAAYPNRRITLRVEGDCSGSWDEDRLAQALGNLVSNAVQYSSDDSEVTVRVRGEGENVSVEVHNEGPPIPEEFQAHLFEPFERGPADANGTGRGLGLGLFIVSSIVRAHGGTIDVRSSAGDGTTFRVTLPRSPPGIAPAEEHPAP